MSSFLDNSGDIILDVTLTETGRVRLSQGQFQISKFALGDDEIQYTLYDKNHPSGSAYYDLEILQTPVLQAMTQTNANINYGLLSLARNDLLYLPELKINQKIGGTAVSPYNGAFYLAVNATTKSKVAAHVGATNILQSGVQNTPAVLVESGLDTGELKGTAANRTTYIIGVNLLDNTYKCSVDSRFLVNVFSPAGGGTFSNDANGTMTVNFGTLATAGAGTSAQALTNYNTFTARGIADLVYYYGYASSGLDTDNSALSGPRGTITALNWEADSDLLSASPGTGRSEKYTNFGATDQLVFGGSEKYDYIDTLVYLVGGASSATIQIPVRIIRYVSG